MIRARASFKRGAWKRKSTILPLLGQRGSNFKKKAEVYEISNFVFGPMCEARNEINYSPNQICVVKSIYILHLQMAADFHLADAIKSNEKLIIQLNSFFVLRLRCGFSELMQARFLLMILNDTVR